MSEQLCLSPGAVDINKPLSAELGVRCPLGALCCDKHCATGFMAMCMAVAWYGLHCVPGNS